MYDYTNTRISEHNARRGLHMDTNDVSMNLDIACQAKVWANYLALENKWEHAPWEDR